MSEKVPPRPAWYKNTYFWIAAALFLLSVLALVRGPDTIRDPGQKHESGLAWWYMLAAVLMYVNGWLSHQQTVRTYQEIVGDLPQTETVSEPSKTAAVSESEKTESVSETPEKNEETT